MVSGRGPPAGVAQLVEHNVANVVVVGSNPITRFRREKDTNRRIGVIVALQGMSQPAPFRIRFGMVAVYPQGQDLKS